ncbi:hypothetical protein NQ318_009557 [Aromia moschata]|uniref:CRAL-TRIO domain-containing protein n=1 Tax=Aromia moschata TaxID=1265417 RepID=A0AAV8Y8Z4_9CUCU|nr:hypothetical protein NQ318_009557 [Aromia moschata]
MTTKDLLTTDRQKVRDSFGKSEKDAAKDVAIIRDWIKTQPHLPEVPMCEKFERHLEGDELIEAFLVTNKFSIEMTKPKIDMYYSIRALIPEMYENKHPRLPHMQAMFKISYFFPLPKLTKDLYRVFVTKIVAGPEEFDTYDFFAHQMNAFEIRILEDLTLGDVIILDFEHVKMGHVRKITLMHLKKATAILEKVYSNRIKGIHIINYPPYVDILLNIGKMVLKPKLLNRIHLHEKIEGLYEYISKDVLPKDYGGEERSIEELNDAWRLKLEEYYDRFDKLSKMKVKEELRPEPLKNDDILGFHGNFKKLDVD